MGELAHALDSHVLAAVRFADGIRVSGERAKFDKILLDNASRVGVTMREESTVTDVTFDEDGACVSYRDDAGAHSVQARFVADAAGHQSPFHRLVGAARVLEVLSEHRAVCLFHQREAAAAPELREHPVRRLPTGWFWYIPLSDELTSVGAVVSKETAAAAMRTGSERAFYRFVESCPLIAEYLSQASRVTEGMDGQFRVRSDYS